MSLESPVIFDKKIDIDTLREEEVSATQNGLQGLDDEIHTSNEFTALLEKINTLPKTLGDLIASVNKLTRKLYIENPETSSLEKDHAQIKKIMNYFSLHDIDVSLENILPDTQTINEQTRAKIEQIKETISEFRIALGELLEAFLRKYVGNIGTLEQMRMQDLNPGKEDFKDLANWERSILLIPGGFENLGNSFIDLFKKAKEAIFSTKSFSLNEFKTEILKEIERIKGLDPEILQIMKKDVSFLFSNISSISDKLDINKPEQINIILDFILSFLAPFFVGGAIKKGAKMTLGKKGERAALISKSMVSLSGTVRNLALISEITAKIDDFEDELLILHRISSSQHSTKENIDSTKKHLTRKKRRTS